MMSDNRARGSGMIPVGCVCVGVCGCGCGCVGGGWGVGGEWGGGGGGGWEEINKLSSMARSHRDTWKLQLISTNTPCPPPPPPPPPPTHTHTHTENKTRWTQHSTDTKLGQRIGDIHSWRETLEKTLQDTETEINTVPPSFFLPLSFLSLHPFS